MIFQEIDIHRCTSCRVGRGGRRQGLQPHQFQECWTFFGHNTDDSAKNARKKIFLKVASQGLVYRLLFLTNECFAAQHYEHKWWNRELTLKCKLKCYVKPMEDPLGVSPSKGNQGTTRGKEKILLTSVGIEPTTSGLDLPVTVTFSNVCSLSKRSYSVLETPISFFCLSWKFTIWLLFQRFPHSQVARDFPKGGPHAISQKDAVAPQKQKKNKRFVPLFLYLFWCKNMQIRYNKSKHLQQFCNIANVAK